MTAVYLRNSLDCVLGCIQLSDADATGEALARAAIELIEQTGVLHEGDTITVEA
jgi:hypothetical protein